MSEAFFQRIDALASNALVRRRDAAVTAVNDAAAKWHQRTNTPAWNYGAWPLTVQKLCADELTVQANCILEGLKQAYLSLPGEIDLQSDRAKIKQWAEERLRACVRELDGILTEHWNRSRVQPAARSDMTVWLNLELQALDLAIDQFADTAASRGPVAANSVVIQNVSGVAVVGNVTGSTIQQGLAGDDLALIVKAIRDMRADQAVATLPPDAKLRFDTALAECEAEIGGGKPNLGRLSAFLTRAGEAYRTVAATPGVVATYEMAHQLLMRLL